MALVFDAIDKTDISNAIAAGGRIWYNPILDRLKRKIKDSFMNNDVAKCCYCSRLFVGEFNMVVDIEHVLPQGQIPFDSERFAVTNLNIACKRCNMEIKKGDTSFIVSIPKMGKSYYQSNHYKFVHPNLDIYTDHITLKNIRWGDAIFVKYILRNKDKALYTYEYFRLKELEVDTINKAQGTKTTSTLSLNIREELRNAILKLLTKLQ